MQSLLYFDTSLFWTSVLTSSGQDLWNPFPCCMPTTWLDRVHGKNGNRFFPKFPWFSLENQFQVDQWPHPQQGISGSVENRGWNWLVTLSTPKKGPFGSYIWGEGWTPNIVGKENPFGAPLRRPRSQVASCCTSGKARVFWLGVATVS